jgi:hypothetical protein
MRYPNDRRFVDAQGKIMDHWLGPLKLLEPLLDARIVKALQTLANASQEADEDDPFSLNAALGALPIDNEPLFTEDWAVTFKNADSRGRRVPLSFFGGIQEEPIQSTALSGNASVSISLPDTYAHLRLLIRGASFSTSATGTFSLSEDGGANFLSCSYSLMSGAGDVVAPTTAQASPNFTPSGQSAATVLSARIDIHNVSDSGSKIVVVDGIQETTGFSYTGTCIFTSVAPIDLAQLASTAGTFDAGTVELWGIP